MHPDHTKASLHTRDTRPSLIATDSRIRLRLHRQGVHLDTCFDLETEQAITTGININNSLRYLLWVFKLILSGDSYWWEIRSKKYCRKYERTSDNDWLFLFGSWCNVYNKISQISLFIGSSPGNANRALGHVLWDDSIEYILCINTAIGVLRYFIYNMDMYCDLELVKVIIVFIHVSKFGIFK